MSWLFLFLSIIFIQCFLGINGEQTQTIVVDNWFNGFKGEIQLNLKNDVKGGWTIILSFSDATPNLQIWSAKIVQNEDDKVYTLRNKPWNKQLSKGIFGLSFIAQKSAVGASTPTGNAVFIRKATIQPPIPTVDFSTPQPSTARPSSSALTTNRPSSTRPQSATVVVVDEWFNGFKGEIHLNLKNDVKGGWTIILSFSDATPNLQIWSAKIVQNEDDKVYTLRNMPWNKQLSKGIFGLSFIAQKSAVGGSAPTGKVVFIRGATIQPPIPTVDFSTPQPSTARPSSSAPSTNHPSSTRPQTTTEASNKPTTAPQKPGKYDYGEVLKLSILFYEAQRSGMLPKNNRVEWREDSALDDQGGGNDLTGGWYDAGDYVKFGFPMASSATVLAWGLVEYKEAYEAAGQYDQMLKSIKWATDYFIKAHTEKEEFYGQVRRDLRLPTRIVHKIFNKQRY